MKRFITSLKYFLLFSLLGFIILIATLWNMANDLVEPNRGALPNYHLEWLKTPRLHGLKVSSKNCQYAKTACLLVEPDQNMGAAKRGEILRQQLTKANVSLEPYGNTQGILVLLHGRNGRKEDLLPVAERFAAAGFKCVLPDLPAHGDHLQNSIQYATGESEKGFANRVLLDARGFFSNDNTVNNTDTSKAGIWGISLGGAFAIEAVSSKPENWQALVIVASFDSLEGVINDKIKKLPSLSQPITRMVFQQIVDIQGKLQLNKVKPVQWATNIQVPVLIAHGTDDELISIDRGKRLFDTFSSQQKRWVVVPDATHQNILVTPMPLYQAMSQWFLRFVDD